MNKNRIKGITMETRRPLSSKSNSCPESRAVDAAAISAEVSASYPGRAANPLRKKQPESKGKGKGTQQSAEGIAAATPRCEGPKRREKDTAVVSMDTGDAATGSAMTSAPHEGSARNAREEEQAASKDTVAMEHGEPAGGRHHDNDLAELMPRIVSRENMLAAYQAVKRNAGAAGVDEMSVAALSDWVRNHWEQMKASLLEGRYEPQPVKRVDICFGPPHGPHPSLRYGQPVGWLSRSARLQARWRHSHPRHPDRVRPPHPASHPSSAKPVVGEGVLAPQPRL